MTTLTRRLFVGGPWDGTVTLMPSGIQEWRVPGRHWTMPVHIYHLYRFVYGQSVISVFALTQPTPDTVLAAMIKVAGMEVDQ